MAADFPYVYPYSEKEAQRRNEVRKHTESFRENIGCALAIERAVHSHFNAEDGSLAEGCARSVLEQYGFKRVRFILANSAKQMGISDQLGSKARQWVRQVFVPPDGKYNIYTAANVAAPLLEAFIGQARTAYQALGLFGPEHCAGDRSELDYKGKVLILSPDTLRESYWDPRSQLWLAESGFGCAPHARGQAVFATCLGDGEEARWNRSDFTGALDERYLPDWARNKLAELRDCQQENQPETFFGGMEMR